MRSIGFYANPWKPEALETLATLADWTASRGFHAAIDPKVAQKLGRPAEEIQPGSIEFAVVIGGDGTLLATARLLGPIGIPMFGVHLGRFGFLTETIPDQAIEAIEEILAGHYYLEERIMLQASVVRHGTEIKQLTGLNEITIARGMMPRLIQIKLFIGDYYVTTHTADGMIFATPTGSTAYNLAAGGPLLDPKLPVIVMTTIAPHSLSAPPLVVNADEKIKLLLLGKPEEQVVMASDGQVTFEVHPGDEIHLSKTPYHAKLITLDSNTFYRKLRTQLGWGRPFSRKSEQEPCEE